MKVLVIIPAYNEQENIEKVVDNLINNYPEYDYVIINDCSTDKTKQICLEKNYNFIDLPINLGIGGAVQTGYKYALKNDYDIAVQFDGDGQHDARFIKNLIQEIEKGNNLVIGSRFIRKEGFQSSFMRRIGIIILKTLARLLTGQAFSDPTSGFRACDKEVIKYFAEVYPIDYPEPETLINVKKKGFKVKEIPVVMNNRQGGVSSINMVKSIYYMVKVTLAMIISSTMTEEN